MRVLVVTDLYWPFPGGAERLVGNIGRDLMRRGHDVLVFTGYETPQQFDGPRVVRADTPLDDDGWDMIRWHVTAHKPDVILTHHIYARVFGQQLVATGVPVVQVVLNGGREPGVALAVYISAFVRSLDTGALPSDLTVLPPVFDDVIAASRGDAIGFVKPIPHKGVALVYAIAEAMPEREFVVLRGEWQSLEVTRPDLANVRYLAPVDDMCEFYGRCRLVLMPSLSEDAGTVAQEATVNGLPCISSDVGGLVETNAGGIRLQPGVAHVADWVDAIRYLDDAGTCADVVRSQREALAAVGQDAALDLFAARIEALC